MSRASIPPMTADNSNPRLNTNVDALISKLYTMKLMQRPRFPMYVIQQLIDHYYGNQPRELFELMMSLEYRWRLALHVPYAEENDEMIRAAEQTQTPAAEPPSVEEGKIFQDGWNEGRNALREEILGDDAKKAIQEIIIQHRLKKTATGRLACSCNRGSDDVADWAIHVRVRIMNYFRNEFMSLSGESTGQ